MSPLSAVPLVCTLTPSPKPSSSELMARHVLEQLEQQGVHTSSVRVVDHDVKPGVQVDMGDGDEWPALRRQILDADILVLATPLWMGHLCSIAQRVLERLDEVPEPVASTAAGAARNAAHLARLFRAEPCPAA